MTRDFTFKGKVFRFYKANGRFILGWSDGWELMLEAARHFGWNIPRNGAESISL